MLTWDGVSHDKASLRQMPWTFLAATWLVYTHVYTHVYTQVTALTEGKLAVVDVDDSPPLFEEKIFSNAAFAKLVPKDLLSPKAKGKPHVIGMYISTDTWMCTCITCVWTRV